MLKNLSAQRAPSRRATLVEPIWLEWAALFGLLLFAGWLLGIRGVWSLLLRSDPTGITLVIIVVFVCATLWCGARSRQLQQQHRRLKEMSKTAADAATEPPSWAAEYCQGVQTSASDADVRLDLLMEQTHGPHTTAWWVNGIQLKLGLLGKVIGFSILALNIGQLQNFDPASRRSCSKALPPAWAWPY